MPREIDCPDCGGAGHICLNNGRPGINVYDFCYNPNCKNGKITVYTQEELDKAVQEERESWRNK